MYTNQFSTSPDPENTIPCSYNPLTDEAEAPASDRRSIKVILSTLLSGVFLLALVMVLIGDQRSEDPTVVAVKGDYQPYSSSKTSEILKPAKVSRGVSEGVSEKTYRLFSAEDGASFPWSNLMLSWQRTAFHFQPENNWMNDPNGPLYYKGWYHLFYQYNPDGAVWGNITWGHAVSKDLIHWLYLPLAMIPDQWYDINGVWTGSATQLPDGSIVVLYTGSTDKMVQVQNLAYPADPSDPLLLRWAKYPGNPVIIPPPGIGSLDFRDPTTAWFTPDGKWRLTVGSKFHKTGISLVYQTTNFTTYDLVDGVLHAVPGTGMWECVDFFPVSTTDENGLDTSVNGPGVKHVLKASLDDTKEDYYALGTYYVENDTWIPDNPVADVGIGMIYDYGNFYASKTFYDQSKQRRVLWGWIGETDSENADIEKGWASVQSIPRVVTFDHKTRSNILQWPVKETESLRLSSDEFDKVEVPAGSVVPLNVSTATQLDIIAEFVVDNASLEGTGTIEADGGYDCSTSGGAAGRGALGPFGLLVLADKSLAEQTPVYFYIAKDIDGHLKTFFCADESRSSLANDVGKHVYGSLVPVLDGEKLTMRLLVDHSIVESFAQGGRTVITSRVYPTEAIYGAARVFLFNNATGASVTASLKIWQMNSAFIHPYSNEQEM
ncbi:PREDICTED: beta-fructofuranosidase, soluble isoenzyme I-like [Nelumbo nucifera]|uniref:Beta-fructofuranosidase n=2 Tax=Nelumbo nucifera TaxID=4432 RepID=A0A822XF95_NELNU|nr:PREDICTED: beta-fructofuranosidase, soluble isoenzyme I-like [Nelumbo nucifera]DAD18572.1 TPA_asm: hypothetical protein HUJ06_020035 [Nelumbo nucifera]